MLTCVHAATAKCPPQIETDFRAALAARDEARIYAATKAARTCLGDPKPETPERYEAPQRLMEQPSAATRSALIDAYWAGISPLMWWETLGASSSDKAQSPLRAIAAALHGASMAMMQDPDSTKLYLERGELAAAYLMTAQRQGGAGVFPTPAWEGSSADRVRTLTDRFVKKARKDGVLDKMVRNGWIIDDRGGGDLQFDNGVSGEAILAWHAVSPKPEYLAAAKAAGDWAMAQPLSTNFNYNGFTAAFLARLGPATGDARYTDDAVRRIRLGVLPGMIVDGAFAGHWIDPHNTRLVYRLFMIRQMAVVASVLPTSHPDRAFISARLQMALDAAEDQQRAVQKIAHWGTAAHAYCELARIRDVNPKKPDVVAVVRDFVLARAQDLTPRVDPQAFHCALMLAPAYPTPRTPSERHQWPK
jgi:hypothetical protein